MVKGFLLLFTATTCLLYQILVDGSLGLFRFPEWHSVKSFYQNGLITAQEFIYERQTLAGHKLNLSAWNGFNEVVWDQKLPWNQFEGEVTLTADSYIWIFVSQSEKNKLGFRLSFNSLFPSGFYTLDENGFIKERHEFIFSKTIEKPIQVKIHVSEKEIQLFLNKEKVFSKPDANVKKNQMLSFRSSLAAVFLDSVEVTSLETRKSENFSSPFLLNYLILVLGLQFICILILVIFFRSKKDFKKIVWLQYVFLVFLSSYYFIDQKVWVSRYPYRFQLDIRGKRLDQLQLFTETIRKKVFLSLADWAQDEEGIFVLQIKNLVSQFYKPFNRDLLSANLQKFYRSNGQDKNEEKTRYQLIQENGQIEYGLDPINWEEKKKGQIRILFLGSSQTWGAGAIDLEHSFPALLIAGLNKKSAFKKTYRGLNLAGQGDLSEAQNQQYQFFSELWQPDLVLINLGSNDTDLSVFRSQLEDMAKQALSYSQKIIFLKEANSVEADNRFLLQRHQVMDEVSLKNKILVFDLHAFLEKQSRNDVGILWWDRVHFSNTAHVLVSTWLTGNL